jgi:hypothetical protein
MNILLITLFSLERNTSVAISNIGITNGLLSLGHRVTWVMPSWNKCGTNFDASEVRIIRIPGHDQSRNVSIFRSRIRSHFGLLDFTRSYLRQVRNTIIPDEFYDIVISTSDPKSSHIFTLRLLRHVRYGRWIQHWGDPLLGDITRNFWWPKWCIKLYEWNIIRKADKIVYVTPFTCAAQQKEYPKLAKKISFIPLPADMYLTKTTQENGQLRIAYLGDYDPKFRNLRPLYDACANMKNTSLTIAGYGPKYPETPMIRIFSRIPQEKALQIENESDVIFCVCNNRGTQIPGKIFYKASTDKHILVAIEKELHDEMRSYLESYGRYEICDNNPDSIKNALESLRCRPHKYTTPDRLLPISIASLILN